MLSIDLFCAADDQHRVKLLAEVLGEVQQALQAGQTVTLRAGPVAQPSDPCLVACTARALRAPWIQALFRPDHTVVAVRLDDTPLPGPCTRIVDIQTWPARSADSAVEALAVWLQNLTEHGISDAPDPDPDRAGAADAADAAPAADLPGRAVPSTPHKVRAAPARSELRRGLMLLGLVVVGLSLLWLSAERQSPASAERAEQSSVATETAAESGVTGAAEAPPAVGGPAGTGPGGGGEPGSVAEGAAADVATTDAALPPPTTVTPLPIPAATAGYADALEHLCRAQTPAAARAWAALLDWKQERRAAREPCVRDLLERPGFEVVEAWLDLS